MSTHLQAAFYKSILFSMAFSLLGVTIALAASGDLDTTFSGNGWAMTDFAGELDVVTDIAIQPDGKIVAAGYTGVPNTRNFALVRYLPGGRVDKTFSTDGKVRTDFGADEFAHGIAVQADGKIVLAGQTCQFGNCDAALARYTPGGALDPTFGTGGKVVTTLGALSNGVTDMALQPDGKIVVCGWAHNSSADYLVLHRYLRDGRLDPTFGGNGTVRLPFEDASPSAVAIQPGDGKIVVAGTAYFEATIEDLVVIRLTPNGFLDRTFSENGIKRTNFDYAGEAGAEFGYALALQPNGKIVVAGEIYSPLTPPGDSDSVVVRYNSNGTLDNTFGKLLPNGRHSGTLVFDFADESERAMSVIVQPDGKLVLAQDGNHLRLIRLKPGGALDRSFNGKGFVGLPIRSAPSLSSMARQSADGKYVIGGSVWDGQQRNFLVARVLP